MKNKLGGILRNSSGEVPRIVLIIMIIVVLLMFIIHGVVKSVSLKNEWESFKKNGLPAQATVTDISSHQMPRGGKEYTFYLNYTDSDGNEHDVYTQNIGGVQAKVGIKLDIFYDKDDPEEFMADPSAAIASLREDTVIFSVLGVLVTAAVIFIGRRRNTY